MTPEIDIGPPGCHPERSQESLIAGPRRLFAALISTWSTVGWGDQFQFGSAHPAGINAVFADGSVHNVKYGIDSEVFNALGNINDGTNLVGQSTDDW